MSLFKQFTLLLDVSEQALRNESFPEIHCSILMLSEGPFSVVFTTLIEHRVWLHESETDVATKNSAVLLKDPFTVYKA